MQKQNKNRITFSLFCNFFNYISKVSIARFGDLEPAEKRFDDPDIAALFGKSGIVRSQAVMDGELLTTSYWVSFGDMFDPNVDHFCFNAHALQMDKTDQEFDLHSTVKVRHPPEYGNGKLISVRSSTTMAMAPTQ